jgi:hypothetical protein
MRFPEIGLGFPSASSALEILIVGVAERGNGNGFRELTGS